MKILAIDTATEACSAALSVDGDLIERFQVAPRQHSQLILPMVDDLLATAGLSLKQCDAIAFGQGPGSFTGLRIAASVVQGLAFGAELPVIPVSSLQALAQGAFRQYGVHAVLAAIDARMDEVYCGLYGLAKSEIMQNLQEDRVAKPDDIQLPTPQEYCGIGSAFKLEKLTQHIAHDLQAVYPNDFPHAQDIARIGQFAWREGKVYPAEQALPVYLRDNVVR